MNKTTQCRQVLEYMKNVGPISTYDAFTRLRITRLPARIKDLKNMGYVIGDNWKTKLDSEGKVESRWKVYFLVEMPRV